MSPIFIVAKKELQDGLRNRWLISISIVFAILSIGLAYFGSVVSGQIGIQSLSTTVASLSSLAVFVIPLIALLLSFDCFVSEQESGTLLLLMTYPLSKTQLLIGKFVGQGAIISIATVIGFGAAGALLYVQLGDNQVITTFATFILSAILLGLSFITIAYVISLSVNEKSKAAGLALLTWFLFALMFDLGLLALLVGSETAVSQQLLTTLMMLNPSDIFRLINLASIDTTDVNGAIAIAINTNISLEKLYGVMLLWLIVPLAVARTIFNKKVL